MATFFPEAFEEFKKQAESLGLDEKSKSKFLVEEWCKMCKAKAEKRGLSEKLRRKKEGCKPSENLRRIKKGPSKRRKKGRPSERRKRRGPSVKQKKENCSLNAKQKKESPPWN